MPAMPVGEEVREPAVGPVTVPAWPGWWRGGCAATWTRPPWARIAALSERRSVAPPRSADGASPEVLPGQEVACTGVRRGVAELGHGPGLDLADPLPGEVEVLANLLEGPRLASIESEAQA